MHVLKNKYVSTFLRYLRVFLLGLILGTILFGPKKGISLGIFSFVWMLGTQVVFHFIEKNKKPDTE